MSSILRSTLLLLLSFAPALALAQDKTNWNLPIFVSDANVKVTFEVDSTWHTVHGTTKELSGKVWLSDINNPSSIHAEIVIPVSKFDTANTSRDKRLREVMALDRFPEVIVKIDQATDLCAESSLIVDSPCNGLLLGSLQIRGVTRELRLPYSLRKQDGKYLIEGSLPFDWRAFGVEDPSILIARLAKIVTVKFEVVL